MLVTDLAAVAANWYDIVSAEPELLTITALLPFIVRFVPAAIPVNVKPLFAVSVTAAVYCVLPRNLVDTVGDHVTALSVKLPVPVAVVDGVLPVAGAVTVMAADVIGVGGAAVTVRLSVVADWSLAVCVTVTGLPLCGATAITVPFAGEAVIP